MKSVITILALTISMSAQAATFNSIPEMSNEKIGAVANKFSEITSKNDSIYGDLNEFEELSYISKASESTLNSVKQLLMKRSKVDSEEINSVSEVKVSEQLAMEFLLGTMDENIYDEDQQQQIRRDTETFLQALRTLEKENVQFFLSSHAEEDGTWATLTIVDKDNNEILLITSGFYGN